MDLGVKGKLALVMGGSSGIGLAIAKVLASEGADLIISGRDENRLNSAVAHIGAAGSSQVSGRRCDLTKEAELRALIEGIRRERNIDILINNTGGPAAGNALKIALEDWDRGYTSLVRSVILLCQLVVPGMREAKWGRILTVTSTTARELIPKLPISSTFRAGLSAWTKELAKEVGRSGILVNNLLPGPTKTDRLRELAVKSPEFYRSMEAESALGRVAEPEELGRVAAFLCSSANTYITGTDVLADGGYTKSL